MLSSKCGCVEQLIGLANRSTDCEPALMLERPVGSDENG